MMATLQVAAIALILLALAVLAVAVTGPPAHRGGQRVVRNAPRPPVRDRIPPPPPAGGPPRCCHRYPHRGNR